MGPEVRRVSEAAALSADPERSIGAYLARQRELRGISLDDLAALTRIPRRSLERLESGVFDRVPDGFVRGFVRTVAAALGLDPDEAVMRLLREPVDEDPRDAGSWARCRSFALRYAVPLAALLVALVALARFGAGLRARPAPPNSPEVILRQDPVRELAREAAAAPPGVAAESSPGEELRPEEGEPAAAPAPPEERGAADVPAAAATAAAAAAPAPAPATAAPAAPAPEAATPAAPAPAAPVPAAPVPAAPAPEAGSP